MQSLRNRLSGHAVATETVKDPPQQRRGSFGPRLAEQRRGSFGPRLGIAASPITSPNSSLTPSITPCNSLHEQKKTHHSAFWDLVQSLCDAHDNEVATLKRKIHRLQADLGDVVGRDSDDEDVEHAEEERILHSRGEALLAKPAFAEGTTPLLKEPAAIVVQPKPPLSPKKDSLVTLKGHGINQQELMPVIPRLESQSSEGDDDVEEYEEDGEEDDDDEKAEENDSFPPPDEVIPPLAELQVPLPDKPDDSLSPLSPSTAKRTNGSGSVRGSFAVLQTRQLAMRAAQQGSSEEQTPDPTEKRVSAVPKTGGLKKFSIASECSEGLPERKASTRSRNISFSIQAEDGHNIIKPLVRDLEALGENDENDSDGEEQTKKKKPKVIARGHEPRSVWADDPISNGQFLAMQFGKSQSKSRVFEEHHAQDLAELEAANAGKIVGDPNSTHHFCWTLAAMAFTFYDFLSVPLVESFRVQMNAGLMFMHWATPIFWTLDFFHTFTVGYRYKGDLVQDFRKVVRNYVKTYFFVDLSFIVLDWAYLSMNDWNVIKLLHLGTLMRSVKMMQHVESVEGRIESEQHAALFTICKQLIRILLMCHLIACCWWALGNADLPVPENWVDYYQKQDASPAVAYFTSLHWSLAQFTPAPLALNPRNEYERVFNICTVMFALVVFSVSFSGVTGALLNLRANTQAKARQFWLLRRYLSSCQVPKEVAMRVQGYCSYAWDQRASSVQENSVHVLDLLSTPLRAELRTAIFQPSMDSHAFFTLVDKVAPLTMQLLCVNAVTKIMVAGGDVLFNAGQVAQQMYFIKNGNLEYLFEKAESDDESVSEEGSFADMNDDNGQVRTELVQGQWIAEAVLWVQWAHVGSLRASSECDLVGLSWEKFHEALHSNTSAHMEASQYAKKFIAGLNRAKDDNYTDLFQPGAFEGIWFRLNNEYNVIRRQHRTTARMSLHGALTEGSIKNRFSQCCKRLFKKKHVRGEDDDEDDDE